MPELAKPEVHQAIKWAIDYDAIAKNITPNTWSVDQSFLPAGLPGALTDQPLPQGYRQGQGFARASRPCRTASR